MKKRLPELNAVRAICALLLMIYHLTFIVELPDYLASTTHRYQNIVQMFVIISAFSIYFGYYERLRGWQETKRFLVRRFLRLAPLFYLMIVIYSIYLPPFISWREFSALDYITNLSFMFNLFPNHHRSIVYNAWLVGVVFIFYLFVPILIRYIRRLSISIIVLAVSLFLSNLWYYFMWGLNLQNPVPYFTSYICKSIFFLFPVFMVGIVDYLIFRRIMYDDHFFEKKSTKLIGLGLLIIGIVLYLMAGWPSPLHKLLKQVPFFHLEYYIFGLSLSCVLFGILFFSSRLFTNKIMQFLGEGSYSIFLLHPFLIFTAAPVYDFIYTIIGDLFVAFFISILFSLLLVSIIASLSYKYIEKPAFKYGTSFFLKKNED